MEEIQFSEQDPSLQSLSAVFWIAPHSKTVSFFPGSPVCVTLLDSSDPDLAAHLNAFAETSPMIIDLEWKPDSVAEIHPIALFQVCSSKGILIVMNDTQNGRDTLKEFISTHLLFGKGTSYDQAKLHAFFGQFFPIEDIHQSRLTPHELPLNFSELVSTILGKPAAQFKDKSVSCSDWSQRPLTVQQILYAAFDAYAVYQVYREVLNRFGGPPYIETALVIKKKTRHASEKTKSKGGRRKPQLVKQVKPKFDPSVSFVDLSTFSSLLLSPDEAEFVPRSDYSPRQSLFEYLRAYDEIECNGNHFRCNLCSRELIESPVEHAWLCHFDCIAAVYFPDQSPRYLELALRQVHLAIAACERVSSADTLMRCAGCGRQFPTFHAFFRHNRLMHPADVDDSVRTDPRDLIAEYLTVARGVESPKCGLCGIDCVDAEAFRAHAWDAHGGELSRMLKHRPIHYRDDTFINSLPLGIRALNALRAGQLWHGSLCCGICKIGFDHPGELFVHLFHRHARVCAVSAAQAQEWPIPAREIVPEMQALLTRLCRESGIAALVRAEVFQEHRCKECGAAFANDDEEWAHALQCHIVLVF
jgi:hypothetical protein